MAYAIFAESGGRTMDAVLENERRGHDQRTEATKVAQEISGLAVRLVAGIIVMILALFLPDWDDDVTSGSNTKISHARLGEAPIINALM